MTGYSLLGSPDRPASNKEGEPVVLNNPVLQKIADKHNTTIALVSCLHKSVYILLYFFCLQLVSIYVYLLDWPPGSGGRGGRGLGVGTCHPKEMVLSRFPLKTSHPPPSPSSLNVIRTTSSPCIAWLTCVFSCKCFKGF